MNLMKDIQACERAVESVTKSSFKDSGLTFKMLVFNFSLRDDVVRNTIKLHLKLLNLASQVFNGLVARLCLEILRRLGN